MPDIQTETPAPVAAPAAPPAANIPADDAPLSAHIEAFHQEARADGTESDRKPRHRAPKDLARPSDVPRIRELTWKVKDAEARAEQHAREVQEWRTKYEAVATPPKPAPTPVAATPAPPVSETFTYPSYEQALERNPNLSYEDWTDDRVEAKLEWKAAKKQADAARVAVQDQSAQADAATRQKYEAAQSTYATKAQAYLEQYPDRVETFKQMPNVAAPLLYASLLLHDNGPDLVYRLAQQPDLLDEAIVFAHGKPVDDYYVAAMQRWLQKRVGAGTTGAAPPAAPIIPAPRPPTPVRTTPVPPTDDPPGDAGSLRDHIRSFHKTDRR